MGWMEMIAILRKTYTVFGDILFWPSVSGLNSLLYDVMTVSFLGHIIIIGLSNFPSYWSLVFTFHTLEDKGACLSTHQPSYRVCKPERSDDKSFKGRSIPHLNMKTWDSVGSKDIFIIWINIRLGKSNHNMNMVLISKTLFMKYRLDVTAEEMV